MTRTEMNKEEFEKIENEEKKLKHDIEVKKVRNKVLSLFKVIVIIIILGFALFYYMRFIETNFLFIKEEKVVSSRLPKGFHGYKVIHFSDLHYMMSNDSLYVEKLVNKINDIKPDIVVFTGDLLDENIAYERSEINDLTSLLANITSNYKYYVKGNHDYLFDSEVDNIFYDAGFINLNNKNDIIYSKDGNDKIVINGLGSSIMDDFDISSSFKFDSNLFNISLFHEPDNISKISNYNIDLALAGHSHNSQINIPLINRLFRIEGAKTYSENYYRVNNTDLYVNQGIGTSGVKYRLFAPPTINLYRLTNY